MVKKSQESLIIVIFSVYYTTPWYSIVQTACQQVKVKVALAMDPKGDVRAILCHPGIVSQVFPHTVLGCGLWVIALYTW